MISFDENGIYCERAGIYIDPWKPVDKAVITHAHSDHARWGMKAYLTHKLSNPVLHYRLGADINIQSLEYGETVDVNGVKISLHPAGHIWGSSQVRLEYKNEIWVVSGDYKLQDDGISKPFEPIKCHHFITECTFGLPVFNFPEPQLVHDEINKWWKKNAEEGKNTVLIAYALGKAQRVIHHLDISIGPIYTHGAVDNINNIFTETGHKLPFNQRIHASTEKMKLKGAMIIAPPSAIGSPWLNKLKPYKIGICSGWMQLRGTRRRKGVDRGFVLSDHADWNQLNRAVQETGAENVYVTHGYKAIYGKWLQEHFNLKVAEADTLYTDELVEDITEISKDEGVQ